MSATKIDELQLAVSNFGPIIEGQISLRPMTVLVGPSNTGKSMLAILLYALHRAFTRLPNLRILDTTFDTDSVAAQSFFCPT